ncbi:MAG: hypothetical protein JXA69_14550 [Phycisphaerae bacterium]|nr:hypothetical protein [Phycisphaerae bacterium]
MKALFFGEAGDGDHDLARAQPQPGLGGTRQERTSQLTPLGWLIADSARGYRYWMEDDRTLSVGHAQDHVAGKQITLSATSGSLAAGAR